MGLHRAAMLTRSGAALGYLTDEEAWDTLALINRALQLSYSSWNEAWDAFRLTRWLWAAKGQAQEAENDLHDRNRGEFLIGKNGLWTAIPWDLPSPTSRFLLLDVLATEGGLHLLSPSGWEDASAWERGTAGAGHPSRAARRLRRQALRQAKRSGHVSLRPRRHG